MHSKLTGRQERAAALAAEDRYTDEQIAAKVGVSRRALARWKRQEPFAQRVQAIVDQLATVARRRGIARREHRLAVLQETHIKLLRVIEERAADPTLADIPGGKTGLIVRKPVVSAGDLVGYEYAVDTGTIRELRAVQEQAAKELGQMVERHEHRVIRSIEDLTDEELEAIAAREHVSLTAPADGESAVLAIGDGKA